MTMMQTEAAEVGNGAERQRRYRRRKREGVVCIASVPIYVLDAETLVLRNRLKPDEQNDTAKISAAIEAMVDDFTEGKLVTASGILIGDGTSQ